MLPMLLLTLLLSPVGFIHDLTGQESFKSPSAIARDAIRRTVTISPPRATVPAATLRIDEFTSLQRLRKMESLLGMREILEGRLFRELEPETTDVVARCSHIDGRNAPECAKVSPRSVLAFHNAVKIHADTLLVEVIVWQWLRASPLQTPGYLARYTYVKNDGEAWQFEKRLSFFVF